MLKCSFASNRCFVTLLTIGENAIAMKSDEITFFFIDLLSFVTIYELSLAFELNYKQCICCLCVRYASQPFVCVWPSQHCTQCTSTAMISAVINTYLHWCTLAIRLRISFPISLNNISVSSYQQRDGSQELKPWPLALSQLIVHLSLQYQDIFSSSSLDWFNLYRSLLHAFSIIEPIHCVQCSPELKALHLSNNQLNPGFELIKIQISH